MNLKQLLSRSIIILLTISPAWAFGDDDHDRGGKPHGDFTNLTSADCDAIIAAAQADAAIQPSDSQSWRCSP